MKKILLLTLTCILCFSGCQKEDLVPSNYDLYANNPEAFVTIWKTDNPGVSKDNQVQIPGLGTNYEIFWEELGAPENNGFETAIGTHMVTFPKKGIYKISISGGTPAFNQIKFGFATDKDFNFKSDNEKIISVEQWGTIKWSSFDYAFSYCKNLEVNAKDSPDLSNLTNMRFMFFKCDNFNQDISQWDVSNVTNMSSLFNQCKNFNQDISSWDVSNVNIMTSLFFGCENFNKDISSWDVSNVTYMADMFGNTNDFNQDISGWDVSNVEDMSSMFAGSRNFQQDISGWDVTNVKDMRYMFYISEFNQDISAWDVRNVTNMHLMFYNNKYFNQDISSWNVNNVTNCYGFSGLSILDTDFKPKFPAGCDL